jgi:branched-chain amino acid transport system substrate-binding protein
MKKVLISILAALSLVACSEEKSDKPVIKIGVVSSFSGKFAENGENVKATLELALQDVAPKNVQIKYVYEDFGYDAPRAATAVNKLINVDKVDAIISWSAVAGNVISPIADKSGVFHFSISNDKNIAVGKYNFIHWTQSEVLADKMVDIIMSKGAKSAVLFAVYQPGLQKTTDFVESKLKAAGIKTERVNFGIDDKDFNVIVDKMKQKNFDVWYTTALPPSLDILLKTILEKDVNKPLVAIDSFLFSNIKDKLDGAQYIVTPEGDQDLLNRVTKKTGSTNYFSVGYTYDAGYILSKTYSELYEKLGRIPNSAEVAEQILTTKNYKGSVGDITVDNDGVFQSQAVVKEIKNGEQIIIKD